MVIQIFILMYSFCFGLNLTLTDYHDPIANHFLDAKIIDNTLIASGMVQGVEFYNISNPSNLDHLTNFSFGQGTKSNCVTGFGNYAYFTTNNGLYVVNISNPSNPINLGRVSNTSGYIWENLDTNGDILAVAAHEDGVKIFNISSPSNPILESTISTQNSWAVAIKENLVFIADEDKIKIVDITIINNPNLIEIVTTENAIKDIIVDDNFLYTALGSDGVALYQINDNSIELLSSYNTTTLANRVSAFNGKLAIADWDDVEVVEWDGIDLVQVAYKNTGNRTMAIAATEENYIYSIEWATVQSFLFGSINGSDIDLNTWELNYPYVENGDSYILSLEVTNNGNELLSITDNYTTNSHFQIINPLQDLDPGGSQIIDISYNATNANASGAYRIYSNDNDENEIICETNGNIDGANIGEAAPDFELNYLVNGNGSFRLSDYLGSIIVLAFFAPN